jgi:hypothetical protein
MEECDGLPCSSNAIRCGSDYTILVVSASASRNPLMTAVEWKIDMALNRLSKGILSVPLRMSSRTRPETKSIRLQIRGNSRLNSPEHDNQLLNPSKQDGLEVSRGFS